MAAIAVPRASAVSFGVVRADGQDRDTERGFAVSEGGVTVVGKGRVVEP